MLRGCLKAYARAGTDDPQGFASLASKEVVSAKNGQPMVRLVPIAAATGLKGFGSLKSIRGDTGKAFTPADEREVVRLFRGRA